MQTTIKNIYQGAFTAMLFGFYHQSNTNKMMKINNDFVDLKINEQRRYIERLRLNSNKQ
jgi:hypothetical protein